MGYRDRVWRYTCGECHTGWWYDSETNTIIFRCRKCNARNSLRPSELVSNLEPRLYIGHDRQHLATLFPVPPENPSEEWAQPYSTRSVLYQLARQLHGCDYSPLIRGQILRETIFNEQCWSDDERTGEPCHVMSGFTRGAETCNLWTKIANLCQTDSERRFLRYYLTLVKDREFPMLIPQVRLGPAERYRVDFAVFVPLQHWKYDPLVVELDRAHPPDRAAADRNRELEIVAQGYRVIRCLGRSDKGYYDDVCNLVEQIDADMKRAVSDPLSIAVEVPVRKTVPAPPS
jgi:very-short-patch-repair endonuclease